MTIISCYKNQNNQIPKLEIRNSDLEIKINALRKNYSEVNKT